MDSTDDDRERSREDISLRLAMTRTVCSGAIMVANNEGDLPVHVLCQNLHYYEDLDGGGINSDQDVEIALLKVGTSLCCLGVEYHLVCAAAVGRGWKQNAGNRGFRWKTPIAVCT